MKSPAFAYVQERLGIQAWSLREEFSRSIEEPLDFLASLGFRDVESYSLYGLSASELKTLLERKTLRATAYHGLIEDWSERPEALFREAADLGVVRLGIAWLKNRDGDVVGIEHVRSAVELFRRHSSRLREIGITPYYHIHGYEFSPYQAGTLFDVLFDGLADLDVEYELDVFWAQHAGQDILTLMDRLAGQLTMLHLKDMRSGTIGDFTGETSFSNFVPIGSGVLDFPAIFEKAWRLGVEKFWIEDESPEPRCGLAISLEYLTLKDGE